MSARSIIEAAPVRHPAAVEVAKEFFSWASSQPGLGVDVIAARDGTPMVSLENIYVDPRYRGKGIGERAMKRLTALADNAQVALELEVGGGESDAITLLRWYERHGFSWRGGYMRREPGDTHEAWRRYE